MRLIDLAVRTWPRGYRERHGDELVATATELANGRSTAREALALAGAGMRRRFRNATDESPAAMWPGAVRLGLFVSLTVFLAQFMAVLVTGERGNLTGQWWWTFAIVGIVVIGTAMLTLALAFDWRGATVLTAIGLGLILWGPDVPQATFAALVGGHLIVVWALAFSPQPADWRIVARMSAAAVAAVVTGLLLGNFWFASTGVVFAITIVAAMLAPFDPRLLAGMCCYWMLSYAIFTASELSQGRGTIGNGVGAAVLPLVLMAVGGAWATHTSRPRSA